ncbi:hypothetical protein [Halorussus halophilus]|uniref:hypothetical protein n=1 Tax=Halorussus halophilus TaxID=2650975 RepID=UPI001CE47806|nr:hypothetical protein [Halorussus halophilus]
MVAKSPGVADADAPAQVREADRSRFSGLAPVGRQRLQNLDADWVAERTEGLCRIAVRSVVGRGVASSVL